MPYSRRYRHSYRSPGAPRSRSRSVSYGKGYVGRRSSFARTFRRTRKYGRTNYRRNKVSTLRPKWTNPISQTALYKFRYEDTNFTVTPAIGNGYIVEQAFRLNSPYDPDATGAGVQTYAWDQYLPDLFTRYQVYGSKITVNFVPVTESAFPLKIRCYLIPYRGNTITGVSVDPSDWLQIPFHKCIDYDAYAEGSKGHTISHYCSMRKLYPDMQINADNFQSFYNTNPSTTAYWILLFDTLTTQSTVEIIYDVRITYYTRLISEGVPNES